MIDSIITIFPNLDQNLFAVVSDYGVWTYIILFFIIFFFETGLVILLFLPGDSLLFMCGAAAAGVIMNLQSSARSWEIPRIAGLAIISAFMFLWIGFQPLSKKNILTGPTDFFKKYGGATISVARFVPVVRTYASFLAGFGSMHYSRFLIDNILGRVTWAFVIVLLGYFFQDYSRD